MIFDLWPHPKVTSLTLGWKFYLHFVQLVIPVDLIYHMTMFDFVIEFKWYLTFWPLPRAPGPQGAGPKKKFDVARPIHVSNSHTILGWILSNGLGGDSITDRRTDRQTDRRTEAITILKKRGDNDE